MSLGYVSKDPVMGDVNDHAAHTYGTYEELDRQNRACGPGWEEVA